MNSKEVSILKHLALIGCNQGPVSISSGELGSQLGISQQSASNWILKMANEGLIIRELGARRQRIKLTNAGLDRLQREYFDYQRIFEAKDKLIIKGTVTTGFGEGKYYLNQKGYVDQFVKKLLFEPYEGTLNLKLSPEDLGKLKALRRSKGIDVNGFSTNGRTFGDVKCFIANIQNIECAVVLPKRSHYEDVLEVISKFHLRRTLSLKDGDEIELNLCL
jgi:riboflavin kinase